MMASGNMAGTGDGDNYQEGRRWWSFKERRIGKKNITYGGGFVIKT